MSAVNELAYVVYEVSDLEAWEHFAVDLLSMNVGERTDNSMTLRNDGKAHRWILQDGPADDLVVSGYGVASSADLDAIAAKLKAAGFQADEGDAALVASRKVERAIVTADPMGNRIELVTGLADATTPFQSDLMLDKFVTGIQGVGHQFLTTQGVARDIYMNYYESLLGFRISDRIVGPSPVGFSADAMFLHCNPRHHSVAFADIPMPKKIHHFMLQVSDRRDFGDTWDRVLKSGQRLEMTIGMHPNDLMFSFYVHSPSGFSVEYGWGGLTIDDEAAWKVQLYDKLDNWGHFDPDQELGFLQEANAKAGL